MLNTKIPLYMALLVAMVAAGTAGFLSHQHGTGSVVMPTMAEPVEIPYNITRLAGYKYARPLLYVEPGAASHELMPVKNAVQNLIAQAKASGRITEASFYLRRFENGSWTAVNEDQQFGTGSIIKIPVMITLMKMNEARPGLLDTRLTFNKHFHLAKTIHFDEEGIQFGKTYTVRELMRQMITRSDNNATLMLDEILDGDVFIHVFTDLGLPKPDLNASEVRMTARKASRFMIVLYNAGYLTAQDSEYCLTLLGGSDFTEGVVHGLPGGCMIAHKYGEGGITPEPDLSETAIIYCAEHPYLLTVMTRGKDMKQLPAVVADIAREVQVHMSGK